MMGQIDLDREAELVSQAKTMLQEQCDQHPAYAQYLERWREWKNPWV